MTQKEQCISRTDGAYPQRMRALRGMPGVLYYCGRLPEENKASVAVVGARTCSAYGREMAQWFAGELAAAGVQIISGMARGVDGIAQKAALERGGKSFAVLGCGTDVCYPKENKELYERLLAEGGIVSEYPAGTPPLACHFPTRNRIISALSDLVLVIEAREKSGTLITVDFALEQGRDVYVLPGRISDPLSSGCNRLMRQGAGVALEPSDILEALSASGVYIPPAAAKDTMNPAGKLTARRIAETAESAGAAGENAHRRQERLENRMPPDADIVFAQLDSRPIPASELYDRISLCAPESEIKMPEMTNILMELVMRGFVIQEGGNRYRKRRG